MRILIAEDDAVSRLLLQKSIERLGHECLAAPDGTQAWQLFQTTGIDVVISDWMMPGLDGIELCRRVRGNAGESYTYFILLTALTEKEHLLSGLEAGADDYLTKPLDRDELQVRLIAAARVTSLYRQLADQKKALEAKTQEQEAFIYTVAHDLRAPLVSVQGMASLLVEDHAAHLDSDAQMYIERIAANARKMQALLDDLLELSRVGRIDVDYGEVDLGEVVRGVTEQLRHLLDARGAAIRVDGQLPVVYANGTRMAQLFMNLIDNAVKYTPADRAPLVQLGAIERSEGWEILVRDNGVGIAPAFHDKIFGLFQRLPSGKALNPDGSGAGLAIVARIVGIHGGKYWLESEEGVGTTFHFTLPKRDASGTAGGSPALMGNNHALTKGGGS